MSDKKKSINIYELLDIGKWKGIFQKEFPNGHFLPLPNNLILTQDICDRFPLTLYGAIQKHHIEKKKVNLYTYEGEVLSLRINDSALGIRLSKSPNPNMRLMEHDDMVRYVLSSWFNAMKSLDQKGVLPQLIYALSKSPGKGVKIARDPDTNEYKVKIRPTGEVYSLPVEITWDNCNLTLRVGNRHQISSGTIKLMKGELLEVPTKYIILTYINQIIGKGFLEATDYREFNRLLSDPVLWLDTNSMGDNPSYGMKHKEDSTAFQREYHKGLYLKAILRNDSRKYPCLFLEKFPSTEVESSKSVIEMAHLQNETIIPEKNGGAHKSMVTSLKGINNCFVGFHEELGVINYLSDPKKLAKTLNRIHTGTGGNKADMMGIEGSNIFIKNIDGSLSRHYGYPINYFICLGRGYGGNSGVVPVRKDFHIPYRVKKNFTHTIYLDNIPKGHPVEQLIKRDTPLLGSKERALASYVRKVVETQLLPILKREPNHSWKNDYVLTLFDHKNPDVAKPIEVLMVSGNNRKYRFADPELDLEQFVQVGNGCVHINAEMYFYGEPGEPFKLRMLGGKATTLPCDFNMFIKDESSGDLIPYEKPVDVVQSNECVKGPALWWIAFAQRNGPCVLRPNEGLMDIQPTGEVVNFLQPNNAINKWLEENAEEVFIEYEVNNEVLRVLRQEPQFIQEIGESNPNADIEILKVFEYGALIRERVIGIHARIPLGYVELSTAAEKVATSTLTSQQFAGLGMLNPKLLQGLVEASSHKRDVVEKMIKAYIEGTGIKHVVPEGENHKLFLLIIKELMSSNGVDIRGALTIMEDACTSDIKLMNLMDQVYPDGFIITKNDVQISICLSVLQIYANKDSVGPNAMPITVQVLTFIRALMRAFIEDNNEYLNKGIKNRTWENLKSVERTLDFGRLNASIGGWVRKLLGDENPTTKVLASLGRITACAQATLKTSHLPSSSNQVMEYEGNKYSIPIFYIHPDDDILHILFGKDIPKNTDKEPYYVACTRTPLGFNMDPIYSDIYALA